MGQANYGAAKAGITALTLTAARALSVTGARQRDLPTRTNRNDGRRLRRPPELGEGEIDPLSPNTSSPWSVSGFIGRRPRQWTAIRRLRPTVTLVAAPTVEHRFQAGGGAWDPEALSASMRDYFAGRDPQRGFSATGLMGD